MCPVAPSVPTYVALSWEAWQANAEAAGGVAWPDAPAVEDEEEVCELPQPARATVTTTAAVHALHRPPTSDINPSRIADIVGRRDGDLRNLPVGQSRTLARQQLISLGGGDGGRV
jgi:hypothetical protein